MSDGKADLNLAERLSTGDAGAAAELVELFGDRLRQFLRRRTRNPADAEDLFQETFRLVLEKLRHGNLRDSRRLGGFLFGSARNLAIRHYQRWDAGGGRGQSLGDHDDFPDPGCGQLSGVLHLEMASAVQRSLTELPRNRDRELLSRYYLAEEDGGRICTALGIDRGHLKKVLFRARQRFRALYERRPGPSEAETIRSTSVAG